MKLIYLLTTAILGLTLAGCTTDELESLTNTQQNTIGFSALNTHIGRALLIDNSNIKNYDFNVCAFTKDGKIFLGSDAYLGGAKITFSNDKWIYTSSSDMRYWPTEENPLDFYAISPASKGQMPYFWWEFTPESRIIQYVASNEYGLNSDPTRTYENIDILYAIKKDQTYSKTTNGIVHLHFKHALAQVVFNAKTELTDMEVDIKSIIIHNVGFSGSFTLSDTPSWHVKTRINSKGEQEGYDPEVYVIQNSVGIKVTNTIIDISSKSPLLVIPQTLIRWDVENHKDIQIADSLFPRQSYLEIKCRIKQNGTYVHGKSDYECLYMPFGVTWEPGKRYTYTLIFGGGYTNLGEPILSPINFEASTEGWVESTSNINANE